MKKQIWFQAFNHGGLSASKLLNLNSVNGLKDVVHIFLALVLGRGSADAGFLPVLVLLSISFLQMRWEQTINQQPQWIWDFPCHYASAGAQQLSFVFNFHQVPPQAPQNLPSLASVSSLISGVPLISIHSPISRILHPTLLYHTQFSHSFFTLYSLFSYLIFSNIQPLQSFPFPLFLPFLTNNNEDKDSGLHSQDTRLVIQERPKYQVIECPRAAIGLTLVATRLSSMNITSGSY